jgi:uncharacterized protein
MKPIQPNDSVQRRVVEADVDLRVDGDTGAPTVEGYAVVFNSLSEVLFDWTNGRFREKVLPKAFTRTLREDNIPLLVEHANLPLATTRAGTLQLIEDDHGLRFRSVLDPSDPDVMRLVPKMRRGDMSKCSFGFLTMREGWDEATKPRTHLLKEARLSDVSIVARPAYPDTSAKVRTALSDDGIDPEQILDLLVRIRQGLSLDDEDTLMVRRMAEIFQRHNSDTTATPNAAQLPLEHPVDDATQVIATSAQLPLEHPLSWYRAQLARIGA